MQERIGPRTLLCGVILHPAAHTRSPAMHNAAFEALGLDARYLAFDVAPRDLRAAVAGARALGVRQLAVSLPHKEQVLPLCDAVEETARAIGAVNTLTRGPDGFVGANTDWLGAVRALERARPKLRGARAAVLGAGGTARAVVFGLVRRGAQVSVLNRTRARAQALVEELGAERALGLDELAGLDAEIVVNTTSVGLRGYASPVARSALSPGCVVLDAVYDPPRTRLLRDAEAAGAVAVEGKWMLVEQAAEQLRLWTGREAPRDVMARAFDAAAG